MRMHTNAPRRAPPVILSWTAALLIAAAGAASAQDPPTGSWSDETPGDFFSQGASASDGTYLYLVGGFQFGAVTTDPEYYQQLRRYDPANDSWITLAPLPFPVFNNAAAYHGGHLYGFGGFNVAAAADTDAIVSYSIATDAWSTLAATLSAPRESLAAATLGDRIYATGGVAGDFSDAHDEFDPTTGTVTPREPTPVPIEFHTLTGLPAQNRVLLAAGFDAAGPSAAAHTYDPVTDDWTPCAPIRDGGGVESPRYGAASFLLQGRVYLTGGTFESTDSMTWEYDPAADAWARRADMKNLRYLHAAGAIGDRGYVYGGAAFAAMNAGEEFTPPVFDPPAPTNQDPVADAGPDQSVEAAGPDGALVTLDGSGSSDPDAGDTLGYSWSGPFGTATGVNPSVLLPVGASTVTLTVTDAAGASSTDTVSITVGDTTSPCITSLSATPDTLWSPNHDMRQVVISASTSDSGDAAPVCEIVGVSCNQSADGDSQVTGALTLNLRAERTNGQTRVYTVTVRCTDASGNSCTATVTVSVPHNQGSDSEAASSKKANK